MSANTDIPYIGAVMENHGCIGNSDFLYNDVIIAPYYSPHQFFGETISAIGFNSLNLNYMNHHKYTHTCSRNAAYIKPEICFAEKCIYCGWFVDNHFGHYVAESLAHVYFIKQFDASIPLVFSYHYKPKEGGFYYDILNMLGIRNEIIFIDRPTLFHQIYIPPPGMILGEYILPQQIGALGVIPDNQQERKIYISRKNFKYGAINENELEAVLVKRNWEIVYPENMPIKAQLEAYASARTIFAISGSALHSFLFLKNPSQRFIIIPRIHGKFYNIIANMKSDNYFLFNIEKMVINGKDENLSIFKLDINRIEDILEETHDFEFVEGNIYFSRPRNEKNQSSIPNYYFDLNKKADIGDSLLYRILYTLNTGRNIEIAKKCLFTLLRYRLFKEYMKYPCEAFLNKYIPDIKFICNLATKILNNQYSVNIQLHRDDINSIISSLIVSNHADDYLPGSIVSENSLYYESHISNLGWIGKTREPMINGVPFHNERIEAIRCKFSRDGENIIYGVFNSEGEWLNGKNGSIAGTIGQSNPVFGIRVALDDDSDYRIIYRVHRCKAGWSDWHMDGEELLSDGHPINAIQLRIKRKSFSGQAFE